MFLNKKNIIAVLMLALFIELPTFAFDINDYGGDFSSRSVIMQKINGTEDKLSQEQKDLLKSKKLTPTTKCLVEQIKKNKYDNVNLLLEAKVNPNNSYYTDYPIYIAAKNNKTDIAQLLIERGAKLDRGFISELFEAVKNKNNEMALLFLNNNARVNYQDSITGNSILYYALKNKMDDVAVILIDRGAKLDSKALKIIKKRKLTGLIENK